MRSLMRYPAVVLILACSLAPGAFADLLAGDLAVVGYTTDSMEATSADSFVVVALADISAGETIGFTDAGFGDPDVTSGLYETEGGFEWTVTSAISAGTVITFTDSGPWTASTGTVVETSAESSTTTGPTLSASGDQITIYNGSLNSSPGTRSKTR